MSDITINDNTLTISDDPVAAYLNNQEINWEEARRVAREWNLPRSAIQSLPPHPNP